MVKWVFPVVMLGSVVFGLVDKVANGAGADLAFDLVLLAFICGWSAIFYWRLVWGVMDTVHVSGDAFVVRGKGMEVRVPMKDVTNIDQTRVGNMYRVTLRLRQPGKLGAEVAFLPQRTLRLNPFARLKLVDTLVQRVDRARQAA